MQEEFFLYGSLFICRSVFTWLGQYLCSSIDPKKVLFFLTFVLLYIYKVVKDWKPGFLDECHVIYSKLKCCPRLKFDGPCKELTGVPICNF